MEKAENSRKGMLMAIVPFVQAAASLPGVQRIALIGSLVTAKIDPRDIDLLLSVEDGMDLLPLATLGRKLQGRVTSLTQGNYGADLFVANGSHGYLGRLCHYKECPGYRSHCPALHCGRRPYLRDDLRSVTLERGLLVAPPLELWPTVIVRVRLPGDVEWYVLHPLIDQLGLRRTEQIIPRSVRDQLICENGTLDQTLLAALHEAAAFLDVALTEEVTCDFIEMRPLDHYIPMLHFPWNELSLTRLWVVAWAGKTCFVAQGTREGTVVFIAR